MKRAAAGLAACALGAVSALSAACGDGPLSGEAADFRRVLTTIEVTPSADTLASAGATRQFTATARDQNGVAMSGIVFTWRSSDTTVATVDATGLARARSPGLTTISAAASSKRGTATLRVGRAPPELASISPDPAVEGDTATLAGEGFSSAPGENRVLFGAVEASVTAASAGELVVVVPDIGCAPPRDVEVTVEVSGDTSDPLVHEVAPGEAPVSLGVGEQAVASDPTEFCLQFEESSSDEAYLVGVQSTSEAAGALTPVAVTGEAAADTGGTSAGGALPPAVEPARASGALPAVSSRWTGHRRAERRLRERERRLADGATVSFLSPTSPGTPRAAAVGPGVGEGDTVRVRVPALDSADVCADYTEIDGVVRREGEHGIWVEDVENPEGGYDEADYAELSDEFDAAVFPVDTAYFGAAGDRDGNGRVVLVVTREVNRSEGVLGFVFAGDLADRTSCASSDEGELTYLRAPDPDSTVGEAYSVEQARADAPDLTAHEFTHLIQASRRSESGSPLMDTWMAEAQAQLAEEVVGHAATGRTPGQNYGFSAAWNLEEETKWYRDAFVDLALYYGFRDPESRIEGAPEECSWLQEDPSPCVGRALWYGVGWSFLRWLSDHLGPEHPGGERGLHRDLVGSGLTGFANVEAVVGTAVPTLLPQWAAALYADDRVAEAQSRLTLPSWNLKAVSDSLVETARLEPDSVGFGDFGLSYNVAAGSSAYLIVGGASRPHTAVRARGPAGSDLPAAARLWVVRVR